MSTATRRALEPATCPGGLDAGARPMSRLPLTLGLLAIFLVVLGARLWLVGRFGADVPYLDQWNGEATVVYLPYIDGTLDWSNLVAPHNEHRVTFTRLQHLLLLALNGQWDPRVQLVVNAAVAASMVTVLAAILWSVAGQRGLAVIGLLVCLSFATPTAWENTLAGFQAEFYYLNFTAFFGIWALGLGRVGSARWWLGAAALLAGLFSVASGLVASVACMAVVALAYLGGATSQRDALIGLGVCIAIAAAGAAYLPPSPVAHDALRARTVEQVVLLTSGSLAWPWTMRGSWAIVVWAPMAALTIAILRRRGRGLLPVHAYLAGLALWVGAHALGGGVSRGALGPVPPSRYTDILALGPVLNGVAILLLVRGLSNDRARHAAAMAGLVWAAAITLGVARLSEHALDTDAPARQAWTSAYARNIRQLSRDGDLDRFAKLSFPDQVPWPNPRDLAQLWLGHPILREIFPASLRAPLPITPAQAGFVNPGTYPVTPLRDDGSIGSFDRGGNATTGDFLSGPVRCSTGGWLRIEVAGYPKRAGAILALLPANGNEPRFVDLPEEPQERWQVAYARCPAGEFRVSASDRSSEFWFAFGTPVEIGPLGRLAEIAARYGRRVLIAGLLLGLAAACSARAAASASGPNLRPLG